MFQMIMIMDGCIYTYIEQLLAGWPTVAGATFGKMHTDEGYCGLTFFIGGWPRGTFVTEGYGVKFGQKSATFFYARKQLCYSAS